MFSPIIILFILLVSHLSSPYNIFAVDPIIIDKSIHSAPPAQSNGQKDVDYHPNEILKNSNVVKCPGSFSITNTFDPKEAGLDSNSQPVFEPYDVKEISGSLSFDRIYSNKSLQMAYLHTANRLNKLDDTSVKQAYLSFDLNKPAGATNIANRSTPYRVLKCQKGRRLTKAVLSLVDGSNQTTCNEQVAWDCGGSVYAFSEKKKDSGGCTPIRLADIAAALASDAIFYSAEANCYSDPAPKAITLSGSVPNPNPVSASVAKQLLNNGVEVVDNCSLARRIETCDKDESGNAINCKNQEHQIPYGSVAATNADTVKMFNPQDQSITNYDLCAVTTRAYSADKANPLSFFAKVIRFFGTIVDKSETYSDSAFKNVYIDNRLSNIDYDQAFLNNLITHKDQVKYQTNNPIGSSTDGKTVDPGTPVARAIFARNLLPKNF